MADTAIVVIDHFYPDPTQVRNVALDMPHVDATTGGFGTTKQTGRLTQTFSFDVVEPPRPHLPVLPLIHPLTHPSTLAVPGYPHA